MSFDFHQRDALGRIQREDFTDARYFRANARAMPVLVHVMSATGVLDAAAAAPALPRRDMSRQLDDWLRATEAQRAFRAPSQSRVPLAKFRTNEAWVVTPSECEAIAASLEGALHGAEERLRERPLSPEGRKRAEAKLAFLREWIGFQKKCSRAGGYEVW
jgi:hypothetical protein